jgi:arylsulfatase A-like enzyme
MPAESRWLGRDRGSTDPGAVARLLLLAVLGGVIATAVARTGGQAPAAPRNLILISLDTLRADHLGIYGYERPTSPKLDAFARRSTVFRRAVAQANSTRPSHAALFTSRDPEAVMGAWGYLFEGVETLAERLHARGFRTWGFVDGGNMARQFGFSRGFDHYEDRRVGIAALAGRVKAWMNRHPAQPFFLFLHCYDIHTPYSAPSSYVAMFGDRSYRGHFKPNEHYFRAVESGQVKMTERDRFETIARYDAGIRYTDDQLGDLFAWLGERGLLASSLVVIVSDHGEEFLEHGRLGHDQIYLHPNIHVPLIVHVPGRRPGFVDETVELVDVVPTILELLGQPPLEKAQGRSLVPLLDGTAPPVTGERIAYSEIPGPTGKRTVIEGHHQLMLDLATGEAALYDLGDDPGAKVDRSAERPEVAARLRTELDRRMALSAGAGLPNVAKKAPPPAPQIDARTRRELEVLGYVLPSE